MKNQIAISDCLELCKYIFVLFLVDIYMNNRRNRNRTSTSPFLNKSFFFYLLNKMKRRKESMKVKNANRVKF